MGKYNGAVITTAGANVISQAISGTELTWTVMRSSSVAIPEGTDIAALTSLTGIEQTAAITDASVYGNSTIQVSARFSNTGVATAYLLETIGIYGQLAGGAETLIAVMTAVTPDQMPVYDADSPSAFIYNSQITVQDAETVVMTVNDSGTATVADLNRKVDLNGGDLSDTKGNTFNASTALYPVISAGDTFKVMCGKIVKFCADIVKTFTKATATAAGAKGLVPAPAAGEQIAYLRGDGTWKAPVFSKITTATGLSLDAREANPNVSGSLAAEVKALNDSIFSNVGSGQTLTSIDDILTTGIYSIRNSASGKPSPQVAQSVLIVSGIGSEVVQVLFGRDALANVAYQYIRFRVGGAWTAWTTTFDSFTRSFTSGICGFGVLEKSGNVCILQYPIADFDPNGTAVPEGLRPKFEKGSWGTVLVTNDYTHQYVLHVENNGRVSLQKDGNTVTSVVSGVRGQASWII